MELKKLKKIFKTIAVKLYFNGVCVSPIQRSREEKTEESMLKNKEKAMRVLRARVLEQAQQQQADAIAADRKSQVGSGDRSQRIRTYNFPQGRVTDHRIGLTLHKLESVLNGQLDELINALITADQAERLKKVQ